ncbi:MAG: hypothetical protein AB7K09_09040 [Planctomycetota bacterium]
MPRPAEVAIGAVLLALIIGTLAMPNVVVEPYRDVIGDDSVEQLRGRLTDPSIAPTHAERVLQFLAQKAGVDVAVQEALEVLRLPGITPEAPLAQVSLQFIASHPVAASAGEVLRAWADGRLPDRFWRERMRDAWAPACGWFVVPLGQQLGSDDRRLIFVFDVLAADGRNMYSVPDASSASGLRRLNGPDILIRRVVAWYTAMPGNTANLAIEERILVNLASLPADVSGNEPTWRKALRDTLQGVVTARRLPLRESAFEQDAYVRSVLLLLQSLVPEQEWLPLLRSVPKADGEPDAWTRVATALIG